MTKLMSVATVSLLHSSEPIVTSAKIPITTKEILPVHANAIPKLDRFIFLYVFYYLQTKTI